MDRAVRPQVNQAAVTVASAAHMETVDTRFATSIECLYAIEASHLCSVSYASYHEPL